MPYIEIATSRYPVTEQQIRQENPQTSYPASFPCPDGFAVVFPAPQPTHDPITQSVREIAPVLTTMGHYEQAYAVVETYPLAADKTAAIAAHLTIVKTELSKQIDAAVIAIYDKPMQLSKEYEAREKAAADYKAAGYIGTIPPRLAGFVTPSGMTATAAADLILSQAAQMRGALDSLSDLRMRKYEVQKALTEAAALTAHTAIMAQIATIAAALA